MINKITLWQREQRMNTHQYTLFPKSSPKNCILREKYFSPHLCFLHMKKVHLMELIAFCPFFIPPAGGILKMTTQIGKFKNNLWVFSAQHCSFLLVTSLLAETISSPCSSILQFSSGSATFTREDLQPHVQDCLILSLFWASLSIFGSKEAILTSIFIFLFLTFRTWTREVGVIHLDT